MDGSTLSARLVSGTVAWQAEFTTFCGAFFNSTDPPIHRENYLCFVYVSCFFLEFFVEWFVLNVFDVFLMVFWFFSQHCLRDFSLLFPFSQYSFPFLNISSLGTTVGKK